MIIKWPFQRLLGVNSLTSAAASRGSFACFLFCACPFFVRGTEAPDQILAALAIPSIGSQTRQIRIVEARFCDLGRLLG
jgi:hypothetical protein